MKHNGKIAIGSILLILVLIGVAYAVKPLPSQSAQPMPPLRDLLLHPNDLCDHVAKCEVEMDSPPNAEEAKKTAEFMGLPTEYQEGVGFYYLVVPESPHLPFSMLQALYRYESEEEAIAHYEQLLKGLPDAPLGREMSISTYEWPFQGGKGQVVAIQHPYIYGPVYWFIGVQGDLLTVLGVLSFGEGTKGQPVLEQLVSLTEEHIAASR